MTDPAGLRVLLAPNPSPMTLDGTRTYLVGRARPVVIDPGPALDEHLGAILEALGGVRPEAILLTHSHADHSGAAPALAKRSGAPVLMARGALRPRIPSAAVDRWIDEGDQVETDAGTLQAIATPGHAPEHLSFFWGQGRALFVGDHLMGEGDTTLVAPPEGDLAMYLESLERVRRVDAGVLYPAHGPPIRDPEAAVERYLEHRLARIDQVRGTLREGGAATPAALVRRVYGPGLHPGLASAAEGSLRAILAYLERRGEVRRKLLGRYAIDG
ncbi:MAG TPA: MBL fold metallo-hydrolase [Longimicrobiaceae bacterium]|nr:MBL fold metallo-hydrolase [Longimicrobiaceae bacterium]